MEDLQMRVLKAEASLREKEGIHLSFQHQLEQYEMKMILMEEMWQKKMSLQVNLQLILILWFFFHL